EGAEVSMTGDLKVTKNASFINSGTLYINNSSPIDLNFANSHTSDGKFVFSGTSHCTLVGDAQWGSLHMKISGGDLFLEGNLTLIDTLNLYLGRIDVGYQKMTLKNSDEGSLVFNNSKGSPSYIIGALNRAVISNSIYYFPLGDADGFHPYIVQNPSGNDNIEVGYDKDISQEWSMLNQSSLFDIEDVGGWKVVSSVNFNPGLSLFANDGMTLERDDVYSVLYATDISSMTSSYQKYDASLFQNIYSLSDKLSSAGIYTVANEKSIELPNFAYISDNSNSTFVIPGFSKYDQVELVFYNRWGQKIFDDHNYNNNFDCSKLAAGTYFYEIKFHQGTSVELVRNHIEIKHER
ncbi:MAG: gliding motility-associated C-terminal domain-containing protein, partial [Mangrovibacterium sp.]